MIIDNETSCTAEDGALETSSEDTHSYDTRNSCSPKTDTMSDKTWERHNGSFSFLTFGDPEKCSVGPDTSKTIYIDFTEGDKRNPANYSLLTKWIITAMACTCSLLAASATSSYNMGFASMTRDLNCTMFQASIGLGVFPLGFGIAPMITASFSEEFGRQPIYIGSGIGFVLTYMIIALSTNIQTVIIARFLQGSFGSMGASMFGGTIADIWSPKERGLPMSIFTVAIIGGTGLGPLMAGWIEVNPNLEWRWIQWIQMIFFVIFLVLVPFLMKETRSSVIITRLAKKVRKETWSDAYRARIEDERPPLRTLIYISCTRPIVLMFTEPIVLSFSLWVGFAWGIVFSMVESIAGVFGTLYGFNIGQIGSAFTAMIIGSLIGFITNMHQERLYQRYFPTRGPEARLHWACFAGILAPVSLFIYAWPSSASMSWIIQVLAVILFTWATFIIYLAGFSYLTDCYGPYASSALAGQSLAFNLFATVFPLFTNQMFHVLGYMWANIVFAFFAVAMIPIPFVLYLYGPAIRKFSHLVVEK